MTAERDNLVEAVRGLEQVLADGGDLSRRLGHALAAVEQAVRRHQQALEADGPRVVDIESPRIPSPVVTREVGKLHGELEDLLGEARALHDRLSGGPAPDPVKLRERARRLLEALAHYDEEEARVIQETVNTDIGAPD
jgi:hypothetical protein